MGCLVVGSLLGLCGVRQSSAQATSVPALTPAPPRADLLTLGRTLFFDTRFSADGTVSCATCHRPERAFTDGRPVAQGVYGRQGTRNTPSLRHTVSAQAMFWDGRRPSLEAQVLDPFINPREHGLRDHGTLLRTLRETTDYDALLPSTPSLLDDQVLLTTLAQALSAYVRSLTPTETHLERYLFSGDTTMLLPDARRGLALFQGQAQCAACHHIGPTAAPLTDGAYHSLAIGFDQLVHNLAQLTILVTSTPHQEIDALITSHAGVASLGRFVVTLRATDIGKFKTPSLRNVADTAPYMHDGSVATLEEAVERELYYRGKTLGRPLVLSLAERADLLAFLRTLTDAPAGQQP